MIGTTDLCGRSCLGLHCKAHLMRLRKGGGTRPCSKCEKGVKNSCLLCRACGYGNKWRQRKAAFEKDIKRLARIDPPNFQLENCATLEYP